MKQQPHHHRRAAAWLAAVLLLAGLSTGDSAAQSQATLGPVTRYFPLRLGDSWTYDWQTDGRVQVLRKSVRTRAFEGTEFVNSGMAYKLISEDGTYHLFTLAGGSINIHGSSEAGRLLYYDPPVVLAAPDMRINQSREVQHPDTGRQWTTTFMGFEDVTVPLGIFKNCAKIRLQMRSPEYLADSYHYLAAGVGLVAYQYSLQAADTGAVEIRIDAQLRLARLSGIQISRIEDLGQLSRNEPDAPEGSDDAEARKAFKRAGENRYTWDEKFPGFQGDFEYRQEGQEMIRGSFTVDRALNVKIQAADEAGRALLRNEISSFISHRKHNPFDMAYADAVFKWGSAGHSGETEVQVQGDTMGTAYTLRRNEIVRVARSYGRVRFVSNNLANIRTDTGRYLTVEYDLNYYSTEDQTLISSEKYTESYSRIGDYWLPTGRKTEKLTHGKKGVLILLKLSNLKLHS